ncbi:hypothetical protein ZWY2020_028410 [Hordeum vulgare]|nr:hypothetical protein ZWY2020_028410 [Hordeum vulgare]
MRLLTHNFLASNVKGVSTGYPLALEVAKTSIKEVELNVDFLRGILPKIDWRALFAATSAAGFPELLAAEPPEAELFAEAPRTSKAARSAASTTRSSRSTSKRAPSLPR